MSIERTYPTSWGVGEKLTSAQQNAIDTELTHALDKRAGEADVLASVVQATGVGRIIASIATGPDADWTFHLFGGGPSATSAALIRVPTLTAPRSYSLVHSGATGGDRMIFYSEGTGSNASGYVDVKNNVGTAMFRLGPSHPTGFHASIQGALCDLIFSGGEWRLFDGKPNTTRITTFTSSGTWVCPPGVHSVELHGVGGGGGGGAGGGTAATGYSAGGGAGGGGAQLGVCTVPVTPGQSYAITIGTGGLGGAAAANANGNNGNAGADTTFGSLATFPGAAGGGGGLATSGTTQGYTLGGTPNRHIFAGQTTVVATLTVNFPKLPGVGGVGVRDPDLASSGQAGAAAAVMVGQGSPVGAGGAAGSRGGDGDLTAGGGGGGGGGMSGWVGAVPGAGGAGGSGADDVGVAGSAGSAGTFGAGGGGGGGCSGGTTGTGSGGAGGAGGSGALRIIYASG